MADQKNDVEEVQDEDTDVYYHVDVSGADSKGKTVYNLPLQKLLADVVIPFRLNRIFLLDGYEFNSLYINRFKVRKTVDPLGEDVLADIDSSNLGTLFTSFAKAGLKLNQGEDVTTDVLYMADAIIEEQGLIRDPISRVFHPVDPTMVFVVTSFSPHLDKNYEAIRRAAELNGLRAVRVDKKKSSDSIPDRIRKHLLEAAYVIADLTEARPNVYWEVGFFDGVLEARQASSEEHLLLVAQSIEEDAHFDLRHRGIEVYKDTFHLMEIVESWFEQLKQM